MTDWLRPLLFMFYAPARGMSEVRDRAALGQSALLALLAHGGYWLYAQWPFLGEAVAQGGALVVGAVLLQAVYTLLAVAFVFVPLTLLIANLFERRGSFWLVLRQEYAAFASTVFYAWAAAHLMALPLAIFMRESGAQAAWLAESLRTAAEWQRYMPENAEQRLDDPRNLTESFARMLTLPFLGAMLALAVRSVFRFAWWRVMLVLLSGGFLTLLFAPLWGWLLGRLLAFPLLLLFLFFILRGYFGEVMSAQRARASFKQNLEAATLNPADASAHYNLGLIHLQRGEVTEARQRFLRAVEIDADEVDAHYQLGRISRAQERLPDAIKYFEQVVARDDRHAQNEIWREIGATYLAAEQFADARDALERFLDRRQSDPEGLYLMGRALNGLGLKREAAESMRACIEAVKTAPAYKYRTDKRWLNEAQQFLRTQA